MDEKLETFKQFEDIALGMAYYPILDTRKDLPLYPALALAGEAGEAAEKVKKAWRDKHDLDPVGYLKELGDCLWYIAAAARDVGSNLGEVARLNIEKLLDRRARKVLAG